MISEFQVIGDEIHFGGYLVARLVDKVPTSVKSQVVEYLDGSAEFIKDAQYRNGYNDGFEEASNTIKRTLDND